MRSDAVTDLPELVLGTAQLLAPYGIASTRGPRTVEEGAELLELAWELGVRRLDTAADYSGAEDGVGGCDRGFVVDTKLARGMEPAESLAGSLQRLRRRTLGVLYIHDVDQLRAASPGYLDAASEAANSAGALLGASIYTPRDLEVALQLGVVGAVQLPASVLDRRFSDSLLEDAARDGVRFFVRSVFLQGALVSDAQVMERRVPGLGTYVRAVAYLADELGRPVAELALQWVRSLPHISGVVVGVESEPQLTQLVDHWKRPPLRPEEADLVASLPLPPDLLIDPRNW